MNRLIFMAVLLLASRLAWAGLAEQPAALDAAGVESTAGATAAGVPYTDLRRTLRNQVVVHEFLDANGNVFALTWSGPFMPDFRKLLGRHFDKVREQGARQRQRGERSQARVDTGEAVVVSTGHMGAFQGRAWLPSRLPAGFDTVEMK